jgi:phage-related protein
MSTGLSEIGKKAGGLATTGLKMLTGATVAAATATAALVTSAVQGYAEYEQLVGGVDTLFKDSSNTVQKYADEAYKTAGLSANEYMSSVTGFSASLLQSLDGDTAKAADKANQAIIDMSDNANKMGSDMTSIQNAYQGFAKQNYTMLDNLKLGYGGTKEEMQRLLEDATKISGIKYDISSYADVVDAIHVMQTEMGIAGTTAKEASTTIEGSVNSMKSAWSNLVVGIADDNADFDGLVSNFVDSVGTVGENLLPRVETAITGVGELIEQLLPVIIAEIPQMINNILPDLLTAGTGLVQSLITGIQENMPLIVESTMMIIEQLLATLLDMLPQIIQLGMDLIVNLALGLAQALPELIPQVIDCVLAIVDTLLNNIDMIIDAGMEFVVALWTGLAEALPQLVEKIPEIIIKLIEAIVNNLPKIIESGIKIIVSLAKGLIKAIPQLIKAIPQIIVALVKGFMQLSGKFHDIGKNIVDGIWNGISAGWDWLVGKVKAIAAGLVDAVKGVFGIHSPSTVMRDQIGVYLAKGLGEGFDDGMEDEFSTGGLGNIKNMMNASFSPIQQQSLAFAGAGGGNMTSNVTVTLEGEARGLFKAVKKQNDMIYQSTGKKPLG